MVREWSLDELFDDAPYKLIPKQSVPATVAASNARSTNRHNSDALNSKKTRYVPEKSTRTLARHVSECDSWDLDEVRFFEFSPFISHV
jgi:hypothetical protein